MTLKDKIFIYEETPQEIARFIHGKTPVVAFADVEEAVQEYEAWLNKPYEFKDRVSCIKKLKEVFG